MKGYHFKLTMTCQILLVTLTKVYLNEIPLPVQPQTMNQYSNVYQVTESIGNSSLVCVNDQT